MSPDTHRRVPVDGDSGSTLLKRLATRVRHLRQTRNWSRQELARRSGLSVRFLARIETGEGNISVLRLEALAQALETTPDRLVQPDHGSFPVVALVGVRGAGKSTVGPLLARRLSVRFIEMDTRIQEASGLPLDQLFEIHGEAYFRRLEREALRRILSSGEPAVVAASGGVVNDPVTWELLREQAIVVWLHARAEDHWNRVIAQGDRRPMADSPDAMDELRDILEAREQAYAAAPVRIDTSIHLPDQSVEIIEREVALLR